MLNHLFDKIATIDTPILGASDTVSGLTADSRAVKKGNVFAALSGISFDGSAFAADAVSRGAVAVLADTQAKISIPTHIPVVRSDNPRRALAKAAARFYGAQPRHVVAVTGTNGKTSIAGFMRQIWQQLGLSAASIGTIGVISDKYSDPESLTTPDPVSLHETLAHLSSLEVDHVALEASSHGLSQYRLDGTAPQIAVFSNFSRDHLDYHGTEEAYFDAKARLFTEILSADGSAIVDITSDAGRRIAHLVQKSGRKVIDFGNDPSNTIHLVKREITETGSTVSITWSGQPYTLTVPLVGGFQVSNVLLAAAAIVAEGADIEDVIAALPHLKGEPGRLEFMGQLPDGGGVYVDYAHTPDGLEKALEAIRPHSKGAVWCVFGAGGDRDPGKRPLMGAVCDRLADRLIVTDDNPRTEDADSIRSQVREGCPRAMDIGDRKKAIETALAQMAPEDVLLIAGKGHETGQTIGHVIYPHDDRHVVRQYLSQMDGEGHG